MVMYTKPLWNRKRKCSDVQYLVCVHWVWRRSKMEVVLTVYAGRHLWLISLSIVTFTYLSHALTSWLPYSTTNVPLLILNVSNCYKVSCHGWRVPRYACVCFRAYVCLKCTPFIRRQADKTTLTLLISLFDTWKLNMPSIQDTHTYTHKQNICSSVWNGSHKTDFLTSNWMLLSLLCDYILHYYLSCQIIQSSQSVQHTKANATRETCTAALKTTWIQISKQ